MKRICFIGAVLVLCGGRTTGQAAAAIFQAEQAKLNSSRVEVVDQASFPDKKGVSLKAGAKAIVEVDGQAADLTFEVRPAKAGRYHIVTVAAVDETGKKLMREAASKFASLPAMIQVDDQRPTSRIVFVPWSAPDSCRQILGVFDFKAESQPVKVWLPVGVRLDRVELHPYQAPAVPKEAAAYKPKVVPPASHPRLWVNAESLPQVRANLAQPENQKQWEYVKAAAGKSFKFAFDPKKEVPFNTPLEKAASAKAFVYLMNGDTKVGREAVQLMLDYLPRVEFGNLLDITREVGAAIYSAACVYDWCYPLCTPEERNTLRKHLMRLAEEMECGWPPFKGGIVNGHGNEAQVNRDLLAMGIALYNEDPVPYQYCAYLELEQLVPMRSFEYQSPRHNQGISYAAFRFGWEMHAAWLFRRMTGQEAFAPNIKNVPNYWLHMRLPNGEMLRDGDGVSGGKYYNFAQTALLCYAYNGNPILKGEFQRQGGVPSDSLLYLLLNDPQLKAEPSVEALPTTINFGPVLAGMVARTGWNAGTNSNEVVAEIKGGGFHFGNHQHADAGALQIYYRGLQVADLGQYKFYGTPFDLNFNKRSVAHSMMLVVDPAEKFLETPANDGGSRFLQSHPRTPAQVQKEPAWHYGKVLSCSVGPETNRPAFSYFSVDLKEAYSEKIAGFVRTFCFLNLSNAANPAAIIVFDDVRAAKPEFKKYFQLNTLNPPQLTPQGVQLYNAAFGVTGRVDVSLFLPKPSERVAEIKSGAEVFNVFGQTFTPPSRSIPEAQGHRILFTPKQAEAHDRFLTLFQAHEPQAAALPSDSWETSASVVVRVGDRIVSLARGAEMIGGPFELNVPGDGKDYQVLLAGLQAGSWSVAAASGAPVASGTARAGENTLCFTAKGGNYRISPQPAR